MPGSRREFLARTAAGLVGAAAARKALGEPEPTPVPTPAAAAGTPPAFGTAPPVGPEVSAATITEAQKLVRLELTAAEKDQIAGNWRQSMAATMERRTGPRKIALETTLSPASRWNPLIPGVSAGPTRDRFVRSSGPARPLPAKDDDIAFATVAEQSKWIQSKALSSERLTRIYLARMEKFDPKLHCIITPTPELALQQARSADAEIAAGKYRGPLHGIPFGVKDLLDTRGILTTYGAEPYRHRVPDADAVVVRRLYDAGAVLVAKLSLGALALNDIWFGGQTMNPWLLEEGSGGSSAGPGAATAAALVSFAIGSETGGSIVDPAMRCGVEGLRPTFGRVARTGAMTLCWSLDKLGPMTRGVEDTMLVLAAITGPDPGDLSSLPSHLDFDANGPVESLRVGYIPAWMNERPGDRGRPRGARDRPEARHESGRGLAARLAVRLAEHDPLRGSRGLFRGAHALGRPRPVEGPGPRRVAEYVPAVALSVRRGLRAGGPAAAQGRDRDDEDLRPGRPVPRAVSARRDPHDHELHGPSGARPARRLRRGDRGSQRLGARSPSTRCRSSRSPAGCRTGSASSAACSTKGRSATAAIALERAFGVAAERPPGF